ncbi:MAG TPA: 2Fe-2S iron-sulfur cluster-binding protein, partial [Marmoricola sp.]|nr:2Fe-2S iron-sulfur cluster-binding protein [Marmoricola sp.]
DARALLVPQDVDGVVDLKGALGGEVEGRRVYCCGPEPMLGAIEAAFEGRTREHLHIERFKAALASDEDDRAFEVELASSGKRIVVEAGVSIIDALDQAGIQVEFSCREGTCGTCETGVLGGIPDHRDVVLTDVEKAMGDCMMICVGRCIEGPLLLDL